MMKFHVIFLSVGIIVAIFAQNGETAQKSSNDTESLVRNTANVISDIGSLTLCLVPLSCDPEITKSIYGAVDRCAQQIRDIPSGVSNEEFLKIKYPYLLQVVDELKSINPQCRKIPFPCNNNQCHGKPLDAPSEVIGMGKALAPLDPLVKCLLAEKNPTMPNTLETIIIDGLRRKAASGPNPVSSVGHVKNKLEDIVNSLRSLNEECEKVKAVNDNCGYDHFF